MQSFLIAVLSMAAVLGVMVLIHELGHYATAKWCGVRVEVFSIGFGTRLIGFRKGETDYRLSAIPLGGYVRMSGENPMEPRTGDPGEFLSHPRWQRFIIAIAGPAMNILLAVGLLTGVYMFRYERPTFVDKPALIGWVLNDTPAQKIGLEPGDKIVRVDGIQDPTWAQVYPKMALSPNQPVSIDVLHNGQVLHKTIVPEPKGVDQYGDPGWVPDQPNIVTDLEPGMPAEKAGMKAGDYIDAVNGQTVRSIPGLIQFLQKDSGKPVEFTVRRDGQLKQMTIKPEMLPVEGETEKRWRVGISSEPTEISTLPFAAAFKKSVDENKKSSFLIRAGWTPLLELTAAISLNLGIFNLFPIPILDGGVILMLFIESLMGHDISLRIKERVYQLAFVFLVLFAVMVIYNDLVKTLPGIAERLP
jgi:regulator of sigma E protease